METATDLPHESPVLNSVKYCHVSLGVWLARYVLVVHMIYYTFQIYTTHATAVFLRALENYRAIYLFFSTKYFNFIYKLNVKGKCGTN